MDRLVTLASLAITPATIILSLMVVYVWFGGVKEALKKKGVSITDLEWFIIGVWIGFLGSVIDNLYWGLAWTADYLNLSVKDWLFSHGPYSNLPFRQITTTLAAYCHLRAAINTKNSIMRATAITTAVGTALFLLVLMA